MFGHKRCRSKKRLSLLTWIVIVASILLLTGCQSLNSRIQRLSNHQRFSDALALIQKEAGKHASAETIAKARELYEADVNDYYYRLSSDALRSGSPLRALQYDRDALRLVTWSITIQNRVAAEEKLVNSLTGLQDKWRDQTSQTVVPIALARQADIETAPYAGYLGDFSNLERVFEVSHSSMLLHAAAIVTDADQTLLLQSVRQLSQDVVHALTNPAQSQPLIRLLGELSQLPAYAGHSSDAKLTSSAVAEINDALKTLFGENVEDLLSGGSLDLFRACGTYFEKWVEHDFAVLLQASAADPDVIHLGETIYADSAQAKTSVAFRRALSSSHISRAIDLADAGATARVAFFHLYRARELGDGSLADTISSAEKIVRAAFAAQPVTTLDYHVSVGPNVPPELQGFVAESVVAAVNDRVSPRVIARNVGASQHPALAITFDDATMMIPDYSSLPVATSSYFSHYQEVANPQRNFLSFQLNQANYDVESAKSSYDWAVSSYNISPSDWALSNANNAYNRYKMAVDTYNRLVTQYNLTPSTIQQPVYLPYAFQQGQVTFGWRFRISFSVGAYHDTREFDSFDTSYVRIGTKSTDRNANNRYDQYPSFDLSFDGLMRHLEDVFNQLFAVVKPAFMSLTYDSIVPLGGDEQIALSWLMDPWPTDSNALRGSEVSGWIRDAASSVTLPTTSASPPRISVLNSKAFSYTASTPEQAAGYLSQFVPLVTVGENGTPIASGSGTLVGPKGMILTASHVLVGPEISVSFASGPYKGTYSAKPIFVNRKEDVAILSVFGLENSNWVPISLNRPAAKGEPLIAVGNPAVERGVTNVGGVSFGTVSNPSVDVFGRPALVADITIASGSSGGPLFSYRTGSLLGVVLAVTAPGIHEEGISSSGYYCLAAPADMLSDWLGLTADQ